MASDSDLSIFRGLPRSPGQPGFGLRYTREDDRFWIGIPRKDFIEAAVAVTKVALVFGAIGFGIQLLADLAATPKSRVA